MGSIYDFSFDPNKFRDEAARLCKKNNSILFTVLLIAVINSLAGFILGSSDNVETSVSVVFIFNTLTSGAFASSVAYAAKQSYFEESFNVKNIGYGFKKFGRNLGIALLQALYIYLWYLCLIIPAIVKSFAYSMSYFIANDNEELTANECITRSKEMMEGHKMEFFNYMLPYYLQIIGSLFLLGIPLLWVIPRMHQAHYLYYLEVSDLGYEYESANEEETTYEEEVYEEEPVEQEYGNFDIKDLLQGSSNTKYETTEEDEEVVNNDVEEINLF